MSMLYVEQVNAAAGHLMERIHQMPMVGIITGTGLGDGLPSLERPQVFDYREIPHFPVSTVQSHYGRCVVGDVSGVCVMAMQGRFHLYEGYSPLEVVFPVRLMRAMGASTLILSNAAGGLNLNFSAGDIMVIRDHINLTGENPLIGPNVDEWGVRFPDMVDVYDRGLAACAEKAARAAGFSLQAGVYVGLKGPSLETPAETRFLSRIGADAVGFSTVMEIIAAMHAGMRILGLSTITNINDPDHPQAFTVDDVICAAREAAPRMASVIESVIREAANDRH
jgi:purine-nucleoside phosphorylase